jgi:galactokinase
MFTASTPVKLSELCRNNYIKQQIRYRTAMRTFDEHFPDENIDFVFSSPGVTDLCGNHPAYGNGKILTAAINLDTIALVKQTDDNIVTIHSKDQKPFTVKLNELEPDEKQFGEFSSIVRGIAAVMMNNGYKIGGFTAYTETNIPPAAGVVTAFEMLIGNIISHIYNNGEIPVMEIARMSESAQSVFFGKRSGLLEKIVCGHGGIMEADLTDPENPGIVGVDFDLSKAGYALCLTNTGVEDAHFTASNSYIHHDMKSAAEQMNVSSLRQTARESVFTRMPYIRKMAGDRVFLRAMHYFDENERVVTAAEALRGGDFDGFLRVMKSSGDSCFKYLQNVFMQENPFEQSVAVALYISEGLLGDKGVVKPLGGRFAGTIQSYVPSAMTEKYVMGMEAAFGLGCCRVLNFRPLGCVRVEHP